MTIDGGMTEEEDAAMQAANADWNSQALASEAAIAPASTNRAPLTIGDFDAEDQKRGREWDKSSHLRRSEEHTSELQSLMRISNADFCLKKKKQTTID